MRQVVRSWLLNPPVVAGVGAVALRLLGVDITTLVEPVGPVVGMLFGFVGFLQVGLPSRSSRSATTAATSGGPP